jgi:hypothetical protein
MTDKPQTPDLTITREICVGPPGIGEFGPGPDHVFGLGPALQFMQINGFLNGRVKVGHRTAGTVTA